MKLRWMRAVAIAAAMGLAAPAWAGEAKDTAEEKTSEAKKDLRDLKPGDKTAEDRKDDAKDTAKATGAKVRKQGRRAKKKVQGALKEASL